MSDASCQRPGCLRQTLEQEGERSLIRIGVALVQAEADHDGLIALVCELDGMLERGVVRGPLRLLHPVEDVRARIARRPLAQGPDAGLLYAHGPVSLVSVVLSPSAC
jgi:hypothetical protein